MLEEIWFEAVRSDLWEGGPKFVDERTLALPLTLLTLEGEARSRNPEEEGKFITPRGHAICCTDPIAMRAMKPGPNQFGKPYRLEMRLDGSPVDRTWVRVASIGGGLFNLNLVVFGHTYEVTVPSMPAADTLLRLVEYVTGSARYWGRIRLEEGG